MLKNTSSNGVEVKMPGELPIESGRPGDLPKEKVAIWRSSFLNTNGIWLVSELEADFSLKRLFISVKAPCR